MAIQEDLRSIAPDDPSGLSDLEHGDGAAEDVPRMRVRKRDGSLDSVDLNKIVGRVERRAVGLDAVDPMRVALRTISGLVDGSTTEELDHLAVRTAAALISEEPNYSRLAARLLGVIIDEEVSRLGVDSFSDSVSLGAEVGLIGEETAAFVAANAAELNAAIVPERNWNYEFFGLRTVYDRYLLRHPTERKVTENPQYFLMRVACGLATSTAQAIEFYNLISALSTCPPAPPCSTRAPPTRRCPAATCSTAPRTPSTRSTTATRTWPGCRSTPGASASASAGSGPAAR
ncbi:MAG: ribonucleotide reductase N-terminal alpha domain-containing protein [Microthrixaceae bacterium]